MGIINQLDYATATLVAAGEVIERPASVCKELIENAVDAGATKITLEIQRGGITLIRCTDNGCGIAMEDLPLSIMRHATSKIKSGDDLSAIATLGFRGEALASIAAVARLRIRTKRPCDTFGSELVVSPEDPTPQIREIGTADGTTIIVENLFENLPARRKFLKKDFAEASQVETLFERISLAHPEISMQLIVDGAKKALTPGDGDIKNAIWSIWGEEFAAGLIAVDYQSNIKIFGGGVLDIAIKGFVGTPENTRNNRTMQHFYVNGRYVRSRNIQVGLEQAALSFIPKGRFPVCVLFFTMPYEFIDVNVHPTKIEVKFANDKAVFEGVYSAVRGVYEEAIPRPKLEWNGKGTISDYNYAYMKLLNAYEAMDAEKEKSEPPAYNNQKNVKKGQISILDVPEPAQEAAPEPAPVEPPPIEVPPAEAPLPEPPPEPIVSELVRAPEPLYPGSREQVNYLPSIPEELDAMMDNAMKSGKTEPQRTYLCPLPPEFEAMMEGSKNYRPRGKRAEYLKQYNPLESDTAPEPPAAKPEPASPAPAAPILPEYRIVGELFYTYVIAEVGSRVLLIDKHAAHERIIFEKLRAKLAERLREGAPRQYMLTPRRVPLTPDEAAAVRGYMAEVEALGFELTVERQYALVSAVPADVEPDAAYDMIIAIADQILAGAGDPASTRAALFEKALYQASCKAAIKAGRQYEDGYTEWVVSQLLACDGVKVCPHGRPVAIEFTKSELERQFGRH